MFTFILLGWTPVPSLRPHLPTASLTFPQHSHRPSKRSVSPPGLPSLPPRLPLHLYFSSWSSLTISSKLSTRTFALRSSIGPVGPRGAHPTHQCLHPAFIISPPDRRGSFLSGPPAYPIFRIKPEFCFRRASISLLDIFPWLAGSSSNTGCSLLAFHSQAPPRSPAVCISLCFTSPTPRPHPQLRPTFQPL